MTGNPAWTIWLMRSAERSPPNTATWQALPFIICPAVNRSADPMKDSHWMADGRLQVPDAPVKSPPSMMTCQVVWVSSSVTWVSDPPSQFCVETVVVVAARVTVSQTVIIILPWLLAYASLMYSWNTGPTVEWTPRIRM
jgi:hypothetical protein